MAKRIKKLVSKVVARLTAWSFSRWGDYEQCPAKAKYKHVEKRREPDNVAMANGTIVHKLAEQFTTGQLVKFPKSELGKFKLEFAALKKAGAKCEQEWAFDEQWNKVDWFAKDAWVRIKVDAHHVVTVKNSKKPATNTVVIVDHKTGRSKAEHQLQRELYALGAFHMYPDAQLVEVSHWYLDSGEKGMSVFKAKDMPTLKKQWEQRTRAMLSDTMFAPRPGNYCRWCHYRKDNGGPCTF